jgi:hypothetical protein
MIVSLNESSLIDVPQQALQYYRRYELRIICEVILFVMEIDIDRNAFHSNPLLVLSPIRWSIGLTCLLPHKIMLFYNFSILNFIHTYFR